MKHRKTLGLALVTAVVLAALAGPGSASATVLCKNKMAEACTSIYPAGTRIKMKLVPGTTWVLEDKFSESIDSCKVSGIEEEIWRAGTATETVFMWVQTANFTWNECTQKTKPIAGGELTIHHLEGTNGVATLPKMEFTILTGGFNSCVYQMGSEVKFGTIVGGSPATFLLSTQAELDAGVLCPKETRVTATYEITEPTPLYVATF